MSRSPRAACSARRARLLSRSDHKGLLHLATNAATSSSHNRLAALVCPHRRTPQSVTAPPPPPSSSGTHASASAEHTGGVVRCCVYVRAARVSEEKEEAGGGDGARCVRPSTPAAARDPACPSAAVGHGGSRTRRRHQLSYCLYVCVYVLSRGACARISVARILAVAQAAG